MISVAHVLQRTESSIPAGTARRRLAALALAGALAAPAPGGAAEMRLGYTGSLRHAEPWVAMGALRFGAMDVDLVYEDDNDRSMDIDYLRLDFADELGPGLLAGFSLGRVSVSQSGRAATRGMSPDGFSLGFGADWHYPLAGHALGLTAAGMYTYFDADGLTDEQDTDLNWHSLFARLGVTLGAGRVVLRAGGVYRNIDGRERTFGDIDDTNDFSLERNYGSFVELELNTDPRGYVGLSLENGAAQHVHFYFQRFF